jgi:hypothetical protein
MRMFDTNDSIETDFRSMKLYATSFDIEGGKRRKRKQIYITLKKKRKNEGASIKYEIRLHYDKRKKWHREFGFGFYLLVSLIRFQLRHLLRRSHQTSFPRMPRASLSQVHRRHHPGPQGDFRVHFRSRPRLFRRAHRLRHFSPDGS